MPFSSHNVGLLRKAAALRVAQGSVREVLGLLSRITAPQAGSVMLVVGHSFGGYIVYSALAQSLIMGSATPPDRPVPTAFADLVLLMGVPAPTVMEMPLGNCRFTPPVKSAVKCARSEIGRAHV